MRKITQISEEKDIALTALCDSLQISRSTLYRNTGEDLQPYAANLSTEPHNTISATERQKILDVLHSERFIDTTPYDVFYTLLDEGEYIASIRTMYRVLFEVGESKDRRDRKSVV